MSETLSVRLTEARNGQLLRREATFGDRAVWWEINADRLPGDLVSHDMAAVAFVHFAMHHRRNLHIEGPVSRSLLEGLEDYTALWSMWRPGYYHRIDVTAAHELSDDEAPEGAIAAFSGGVDATFTLWRHLNGHAGRRSRNISTACLIHGFDIPIDNHDAFRIAARNARDTLRSVDVPLATLRTNWQREVCLDWEMEFGAGISAALRNWQGDVGSALLGSDEDYRHLITPWGSHPIPFQMMSSSDFRVVYDSGEFTRSEKVAALSAWPEATRNLRVCWEGQVTGRNCGLCEKCVRTKMNFLAVGAPLPDSLAGEPDPRLVRRLRARNAVQMAYLLEIQTMAAERGVSGPWLEALRAAIGRNRLRTSLRPIACRVRGAIKAVGEYRYRKDFRAHRQRARA